jgi:hypothetical protein
MIGWKPISLLSVSYKIMAKGMVLRVTDVNKKIVHKEKIGFVQGNFILQTMIFTCESIEWATEFGQMLFSLDKVYDHIYMTFITNLLYFLGFCLKCAGMVNTLFSCASFFCSE